MNLLSIEQVSKTLSDTPLFQHVSLGIDEGDRVGVIGDNGAGKSTLLRLMTGEMEPDEGTIARNRNLRISILHQEVDVSPETTLDEFFYLDSSWRVAQLHRYKQLSATYNHSTGEEGELAHLTEIMDREHVWDMESSYASRLAEFGMEDMNATFASLSGGMRKKAALARALASRPNLLFLDEPTNHLDIETLEWLESYILTEAMGCVVVTHDRYFLDTVCTRICELDQQTIFVTEGNYQQAREYRQKRLMEQEKQQQRLENTLRREKAWLHQGPKARTGKDKQRVQRVYDLMDQHIQEEHMQAQFSSTHRRLGKKVLELRRLSKSYDRTDVIKDFSYTFRRGERIGLIGPNGSGKTTLLQLIAGRIEADRGEREVGVNTVFGYYDQHSTPLKNTLTVLEFIEQYSETVALADRQQVSAERFLELFGFPARMHRIALERLSGGERRRLYLISLLINNPNFLLLDEPTNDLDIETMERLETYLESFSGCVLVVSHDRAFLDRTVDTLFIFDGSGHIRGASGTYSDYREYLEAQKSKQKSDSVRPPAKQKKQAREKKGLTFKEQREYEQLFADIEELERRKAQLEGFFADQRTDPLKLPEYHREYQQTDERLKEVMDRWEELSAKEEQ
ncbi:MAG: ABC-F family ATP-binding cassette domain-containing protein [Spirochaetota bacterium]